MSSQHEIALQRLVAQQLAQPRARQLDIDDAQVSRAESTAVDVLRGTRGVVREDLFRHWNESGVGTDGQRGYHLLWQLAQRGTVCLGPMDGNRQQRIVLVDEWITRPRMLEGDDALAELATRYVHSHGPATVRDLARWAGVTTAVARTAAELAAAVLGRSEIDGTECLHDPAVADLLATRRAGARGVFLLPGDRRCVRDAAWRRRRLMPS